jgi:D-tyrosyl-tRNA(Tyr) deacylase
MESEPHVRSREAVFFFCLDRARDPFSSHVWRQVEATAGVSVESDGPVSILHASDAAGNQLRFVGVPQVVNEAYGELLPLLLDRFASADAAAVVNWHAGANAPTRIFCLHSTGDVVSGHFGPADPIACRNLLHALEAGRRRSGVLQDWTVLLEATHWSGVIAGDDPARLLDYPVPIVDIEVGSDVASWDRPEAAAVVAEALWHVFDAPPPLRSVLLIGGRHFESSYSSYALEDDVAVSHMLATRWLDEGGYSRPEAMSRLLACARSITGGVGLVVYRQSLKGPMKDAARALADRIGVAAVSHHTVGAVPAGPRA